VSKLISDLSLKSISAINSTRNELAKAHARYMVGGRKTVSNERIFRFSFPERPGALKHFLETMNHSWNVSLFHYRNFGGDVGKVLCGIQVPEETRTSFEGFLKSLMYPYIEETGNEVYTRFLK
jgi:threonine dehydratase